MQVINTVAQLRQVVQQARDKGMSIGFVPTMGNLHEGHICLVRQARKQCDLVVASIFVNPLQFAAGEDLDTYPRTLEADKTKLTMNGCDLLFAPSIHEIYPQGQQVETTVELPELSKLHCGITRPHFFKGVATVVVKLLGMVQPDQAFFGEKDFQQLTIIRQVVQELFIPTEIIGVPTIREASGLAMSSRNGYLSESERQQAALLYQLLLQTKQQIQQGELDFTGLELAANAQLAEQGFVPDYFHICHKQMLLPATVDDRELVILAAAKLGSTRLIDNICFEV